MLSKLQKNKDKMMKYYQRIYHKIMLKLETKTAECIATKSDQFHYQIEDIYLSLFSVDLKNKTCSCRRWDLTRIPSNHPIAVIWVKNDEPEIYVMNVIQLIGTRRVTMHPSCQVRTPIATNIQSTTAETKKTKEEGLTRQLKKNQILESSLC